MHEIVRRRRKRKGEDVTKTPNHKPRKSREYRKTTKCTIHA